MGGYVPVAEVRRVAVLGTGTIGASWASWFLARGYDVVAWDPAEGWRARLEAFTAHAMPQVEQTGAARDPAGRLTCVDTPEEAVAQADFVQENATERLGIKQALYKRIDKALPARSILATSTSGLILSDLVAGLESAPRFVVGHPFNPPHLIPLVEVVASRFTDPEAAQWAHAFYAHIGKHPIMLRKEVPGHLANRLQVALWREAFNCLQDGLADAADIDAAIAQGPGLRYALYGPNMIFNMTGGRGGIRASVEQFGPAFEAWWATMQRTPVFDDALKSALIEGVDALMAGRSMEELEAERDARLIALLKLLGEQKGEEAADMEESKP
ncbi:MAG: carnitine 3-dehydrogenase [Saliniramus fredricksonii]|uniref:Carnitine 3-dehydrogenase n=1 Tax=Saliniramus fredricksonii TaxID=1653334 RepID=A0A0P7YDU4_9HYPH|nr:3-hydroxyacyl-CoA dehydrogenase NAD-binding domain-containing protein [Saliniramus fredricksonii]KPQ12569.1 MAG: carnitine 3-dehydrogenase [Saliniramus fredricksonii]SCC82756.1 carnitine 3-dehydrogenase [Saliniramus fredricksonii]